MQHSHTLRRSLLLALTLLAACAASAPGDSTPSDESSVRGTGLTAAYLTGRFAAMQHDEGFAADQLLRALAADPDNPDLRQQAFMATLEAGRPEAVQIGASLPTNPVAQLLLADSDAKAGRWEQAETRFAAMPRQELTQLLQPLLVAWSQSGAGHVDTALSTLRPYLEGQRVQAIYALHAALIADLGRRPADAARYYRLAQSQFGGPNLELARMVASWQARQGYPVDAAASLRTLAEASPDVSIALKTLEASVAEPQVRNSTDGIAEAYLALAASLRQQDANEAAGIMLRLALDLRPDLTAARLLGADIEDGNGEPNRALRLLAPVQPNDPLYPVVQLRRIGLTDRLGDSAEALRMLDSFIREHPDRPEPLVMQADILRGKRRFGEAVAAYDRALVMIGKPTRADWGLYYNRGIALERAHQWNRAEADLLKALELFPDQPFVLNYLGYSWTEQGRNLTRARQMIERAAELRPNDGEIADSLGWVVYRQGDVRGAIKNLERAVELEPADATINGHLGDAYWAAGRKLEAQYQWRRSLALNPEPEDVPKLQAKLRDGDQSARQAPPATAEKPANPPKTVQ
jgi:tetratricopeptide (TPR) repeat protein